MTSEDVDRQLQYLSLDELEFDPENPRLPTHQHGATADVAIEWLLDRANLLELMKSIGQQGFFAGEPILVVTNADGSYKVVEGNRRFGACLLLSHPERARTKVRAVAAAAAEADHKPTRIPALVFQDESQVLSMLGYRHITGIQEWGPLAKARYLRRMWDSPNGPEDYYERLRYVARSIGSKSDYVARLMTALALYEEIAERDFFQIADLNESTISFSLLVVAMNRPDVAQFIGLEDGQDFDLEGLDYEEFEQLTRWLYEKVDGKATVLQESRNFTTLVEVINHPGALARLREPGTSLQEAHRLITSDALPLASRLADVLSILLRIEDEVRAEISTISSADLEVMSAVKDKSEVLQGLMVASLA